MMELRKMIDQQGICGWPAYDKMSFQTKIWITRVCIQNLFPAEHLNSTNILAYSLGRTPLPMEAGRLTEYVVLILTLLMFLDSYDNIIEALFG
jgi:hypothetical protein